ncbi:MAG: tetratricopeptide repeat protein [Bacteroidetes bacterium]|nr:tetratricopeptide repeat protein [Bacteroidota bacterium]MBI3483388.1 tetratricopeptide repeat protein [Bacteroidota bacterium]
MNLLYQKIAFAITLLFLAQSQSVSQQHGSAKDSINDLIKDWDKSDTTSVNILNRLAFDNYYRNPEASLKYAFAARSLADSLHYNKGFAEAYRQIGLGFWALADMASSIHYFFNGLRIAQANKLRQVEANILGNIGMAYNGMNNPREGLKFLNEARQKQQDLKNEVREASVLNNIGDSYFALKEFSNAMAAYSRALEISLKTEYSIGVTTNTRNVGNVFEARKAYDSALRNYQKSLMLATSIGDNRGIILSNKSIASVYFKLKKIDLAEQHALVALKAAEKANLRSFMRDSYKMLYEINEAEGKLSDSYRYLRLYSLYLDSVQNMQVVSEVAAQRVGFETQKKQNEIYLLKKDAELQNQKLTATWVILFLLLGLLGLAIRYYKIQRRTNELLSEKNSEIETQRDSLEVKSGQLAEAHQKIMVANERLVELNEEKNNLIGIVAHDLKSPLNQICGIIEVMRLTTNGMTAEQKEYNALIEDSSNRLKKMISKILDVNAIESKTLNITLEEINVTELLSKIVDGFSIHSAKKDITITMEFDNAVTINSDRNYATEIFENLMSNAVKYSPLGKQVTVKLKKNSDHVRIEFIDEGPGISEGDKKKLFSKYHKLTAKPTAGEDSTGLGLSIVKKYTDALGGRVSCESEVGAGCNFIVEFQL